MNYHVSADSSCLLAGADRGGKATGGLEPAMKLQRSYVARARLGVPHANGEPSHAMAHVKPSVPYLTQGARGARTISLAMATDPRHLPPVFLSSATLPR